MDVMDKATGIRQGEELDERLIEGFLKDNIPGLDGKLTIEQFPSGYSNLTYLVQVGDMGLVLRRPPFGKKAKTAHDMSREYRILKALHSVFKYAPEPLAYCDDESIMGAPFYAMERIQGVILRRDPPGGLRFSQSDMRQLCENLIDVHCELHSVDYKSIQLDEFGKPTGYVRRQIEGWSKRYRNARTDDAPDFEPVVEWLSEKMPPDFDKPSVIHGDFKLDNVVLAPENPLKIIGVLDWEMATIGDPLMDLGSSLGYWVQADDPQEFQTIRTLPTNIPGAMTRAELVDAYASKMGIPIGNFDFYQCFGFFRLAVIAQQIYYRSYHGQTRDTRFQALIFAVRVLEKAAQNIVDKSKL